MEHDETVAAASGKSNWLMAGSFAIAAVFAGLLYFDGFFASKVDIELKENTPPVIIEGN